MYVHLTTHSAYSLQEGLNLPEEIVQAARLHQMAAVGLTDHNLLSGAIEFIIACSRVGVQPVVGLEIDMEKNRLSLLATSMEGWSNLCRISSTLQVEGPLEHADFLNMLERFANDLIVLSKDLDETLNQLKEIYPGSLYLAIDDPKKAVELVSRARRIGIPAVVTHPVYFLEPEQASLQKTLSALRLNLPIDQSPLSAAAPDDAYFINSAEIERRYSNFPNALAATIEIAARCNFIFQMGKLHMPTVPLPPSLSAAQFLRQKAEEGARKLYGPTTPEIQTRLDHELEVIANMGFEPIFLIVEEILNYARFAGVPYSSRGSAASSLVAHCLGITSPDPLKLNLYFERFLNPARKTPPDIDTDLCSRRRDSVINHVFEVYGPDRVAMVGTINRYRPRSALGEVAKAHRMDPIKIKEMVNQLPNGFFARGGEDEENSVPVSPFTVLQANYPAPYYQNIFSEAEALLKLPRHLSVHAGGLIVAPGPLTDYIPIMRSGSKGITITQLDLGGVEALGLVKIDLLGVRGLTVVGDVAEFITDSQPGIYKDLLSVLDAIPSENELTSSRIENGQTIGCFQIESPGMRATLREIKARTEEDIMAALALYRPGPLSGGLKDAFVRRFKGEEQISHLHPSLAPLLEETYGVILYQEQVLRIAHELAGFSLEEADLLRRAMSHFDPGRQMQLLEQKFIQQAKTRSGLPEETGERVWEMIAAFSGYGFPKAHAASYARIAWRSAWCKTHFAAEFMAAVLANWGGYYSQRVYLSEAYRMGLIVRPPHVNYSKRNFIVFKLEKSEQKNVLYMGLDQIKDLTLRTIERIINNRPFHSLDDFLTKVNPRLREAESLACVGALEGLGAVPAVLQRLSKRGWYEGQMSLFAWDEGLSEDWTLEKKGEAQQRLLGVNLEFNPLELLKEKFSFSGAISTVEASGRIGQRITLAGLRQSSHRSKTTKGDLMMFLTLEDQAGIMDIILFPDVYRKAKSNINFAGPFLVTGIVELDSNSGEPFLRAEKLTAAG